MTATAPAHRARGWSRALWIVYGIILAVVALIFVLGMVALRTVSHELERSSGVVKPERLESLRERNRELGRDPRREAAAFREDLLRASLQSLPWNDYLQRPALRHFRSLLLLTTVGACLSCCLALAVGFGRDGARWGVLASCVLQLIAFGLAAMLVAAVGARILDDVYTDLRLRQDEVSAAIGTQAPLAGFEVPDSQGMRWAALAAFVLFSSPWQVGLFLIPMSTRRRHAETLGRAV